MYILDFSRYDCPGCDAQWFFDSIEDIEAFIQDAYPKFPVAEWPTDCQFYPNGLSIWEVIESEDLGCEVKVYPGGKYEVLMMRSMIETHDYDYHPPESLCAETDKVAKLIYDLQGIIDKLEEGEEYVWPIEQIVPQVDKEDLVKTVFHPIRVENMGGPAWLECV
jgi:hypothetical protein